MNGYWIALLLAMAGGESQWVALVSSTEGTAIEADTASVERSGDTVTGWLRYTFAANRPILNGQHIAKGMVHATVDCAARTIASDSGAYYNEHDEYIGPSEQTAPQQPPPDTTGAAVIDAACNLPPQ